MKSDIGSITNQIKDFVVEAKASWREFTHENPREHKDWRVPVWVPVEVPLVEPIIIPRWRKLFSRSGRLWAVEYLACTLLSEGSTDIQCSV